MKPSGIFLAYFMQALILLNVAYSVYIGDWFLAIPALFAFFLTIVPHLVERRANITLPWKINFLVALSLYLHVAGHVAGFYDTYSPLYDKLAHLISAITVAVLGFVVVFLLEQFSEQRCTRFMIVFFVIMSTMGLGAIWEIYEFTLDTLFGLNLQHGLEDTMWDLIFNLFGALIVASLANFYLGNMTKEDIKRMLFGTIRKIKK
ncbi:MAG TPA: hypothetical protein ENN85_04655 [Methanoculleus sp.]|nr:hypothetical protein [Methanoculleus sp.]